MATIHYVKLSSKVSKGDNRKDNCSKKIRVKRLRTDQGRIWKASKLVFDFSKSDTWSIKVLSSLYKTNTKPGRLLLGFESKLEPLGKLLITYPWTFVDNQWSLK
jgi:hypothetical protein